MTIAGLMSKSKYSHNVIRTGDIKTNAPYMVLRSELGTSIQLPFPQNLSSSTLADWQQESVSMIKFARMHGDHTMPTSIKDVFSEIPSAAADAVKGGWDAVSKEAPAILARARDRNSQINGIKIAMNPRNEMMFHGMSFKSYSFNFQLVPYKQSDSDDIQQAIREIQKASVPKLRGMKMFMEYPETWHISFHGSNEYLMKINECCCTRVDVNYSPNGQANQLHKFNAPVAIELSLDFTEVVIPSKENIDEFNG